MTLGPVHGSNFLRIVAGADVPATSTCPLPCSEETSSIYHQYEGLGGGFDHALWSCHNIPIVSLLWCIRLLRRDRGQGPHYLDAQYSGGPRDLRRGPPVSLSACKRSSPGSNHATHCTRLIPARSSGYPFLTVFGPARDAFRPTKPQRHPQTVRHRLSHGRS